MPSQTCATYLILEWEMISIRHLFVEKWHVDAVVVVVLAFDSLQLFQLTKFYLLPPRREVMTPPSFAYSGLRDMNHWCIRRQDSCMNEYDLFA
jgi:hypothetical protein